jgi:cytochrome c oxidase subunit 1
VDFATHDTYFVVAHFHSVVMSLVMAAFAGFFFWYPKMTGRMLREGLGKATFWLMLVGTNVTFLPQYLLGLKGMPRRIAEYAASDGFTTLNRISSAGSALLFLSVSIFLVNVVVSWWKPIPAGDNPWDASSLEWATTSPPPHHNFLRIPPVRSQRPVWDYNHPEDRTIEHAKRRPVGLVASADGGTVLLEDVQLDDGDTLEKWDPDR